MKERELNKIIREHGKKDSAPLIEALEKENLLTPVEKDIKHSEKRKGFPIMRAAAVTASVAVVSLAIILPSVLHSDSIPKEQGGTAAAPQIEYDIKEIDGSVQNYNDEHGVAFLYLEPNGADVYDLTEYSDINSGSFMGLTVRYENTETLEKFEYTVCADEPLDFLAPIISACNTVEKVSDLSVTWGTVAYDACGIFDYGGYGYYLTVKDGGRDALFDCIERLIREAN